MADKQCEFNNFDEFMVFIKTERKNIPLWSQEECKVFADKVASLLENDSDFKTKYDAWVNELAVNISKHKPIILDGNDNKKKLEASKKEKNAKKTESGKVISLDEKGAMKVQALKKIKASHNKVKENAEIKSLREDGNDHKTIVIGGTKKDEENNKQILEMMKKKKQFSI